MSVDQGGRGVGLSISDRIGPDGPPGPPTNCKTTTVTIKNTTVSTTYNVHFYEVDVTGTELDGITEDSSIGFTMKEDIMAEGDESTYGVYGKPGFPIIINFVFQVRCSAPNILRFGIYGQLIAGGTEEVHVLVSWMNCPTP